MIQQRDNYKHMLYVRVFNSNFREGNYVRVFNSNFREGNICFQNISNL
jgi:hypothetical protein